jgi:hypothetical protein
MQWLWVGGSHLLVLVLLPTFTTRSTRMTAPHLHDKKHKDDVNNTDDAEAEDPHGGELGRYSGGGHSGAAHVLYAELFVTAGSSTTTHTVSLSLSMASPHPDLCHLPNKR